MGFTCILTGFVLLYFAQLSTGQSEELGCDGFVSVEEFHNHAKENLEPRALHYIDGTALNGVTYGDNIKGFSRLRIKPRYLRDVSNRSLNTTVLGQKILIPIGISPHAAQCSAHPDGEKATAIAARDSGAVMVLSTYSTIAMEKVAEAAPGALLWFQLHLFPNRDLTLDMVRRAERAGYKALVLTLDFPLQGIRYFWDKEHYSVPDGYSYGNFDMYLNGENKFIKLNHVVGPDENTSWDDIAWLKSKTTLPIVLKGILTAEDAKLAVRFGASAVLVSNHGGRQLDGAPATIDVLPEIVKAVQGRIEVYIDSGVRNGADVFKAIALGAKAVFYGRPNVWGLSYQGSKGAQCVLKILRRELDVTMALAGFRNVNSISRDAIAKECSSFHRFC